VRSNRVGFIQRSCTHNSLLLTLKRLLVVTNLVSAGRSVPTDGNFVAVSTTC